MKSIHPTIILSILLIMFAFTYCAPSPPKSPDQPTPTDKQEQVQSEEKVILPEIPNPIDVGDKFPSFKLKDSKGEMVNIEKQLGESKFLVVNFWTITDLDYSRQLDLLQKVFDDYSSAGAEIIAINTDSDNKKTLIQSLIEGKRLSYPVISSWDNDTEETPAKAFGREAKTGNFIINADGIVIFKNIFPEKIEEIVSALLAAKSPYEPTKISVELFNIEEGMPKSEQTGSPNEPSQWLVTVNVEKDPGDNLEKSADETYEVTFAYRIVKPTGEITYFGGENEGEPSQPTPWQVATAENVVRLVGEGTGNKTSVNFFIIPPDDIYAIQYWAEVHSSILRKDIMGGYGEKRFTDLPFIILPSDESSSDN
ncbi:MAG: redoxin domain-containing protein [bacterium]